MPQGGIDAGETPEEAALRELHEEIGTDKAEILAKSRHWLRYDLPSPLVGKVWQGRYRGQEQCWFALRFLGEDGDIDVATAHPEFDAWRWVELDEVPALVIPFQRATYRAVVSEFRDLPGRTRGSESGRTPAAELAVEAVGNPGGTGDRPPRGRERGRCGIN